VHSGQAIGVLGGAMKPGDSNIGLQMIAAKDAIDIQAQSDTLKVQARDEVNVVSANAHIDWAAAKSISLSTAGGANITIESGNITIQCPGKITINAGKKSFSGGERSDFTMPHFPLADLSKSDIEFRHFTEWGEPLAGRPYKATLSDGSIRKGTLDKQGYARLSDIPLGVTAKIEYLRDLSRPVSHVGSEIAGDLADFFALEIGSEIKNIDGKNGQKK
jgi:type VI secretion system secreted protein VgrG